MDKRNLRIIFLGTPEFASYHLEKLLDNGFRVVAVITNVDKPSGRNLRLTSSAVKNTALQHGLPVFQPSNLKDTDFLARIKALQADVQVVVAFRMLPELLWNMPPLGTINMHASLLPAYRGAAPINWVLINGEKNTGVTTFKLQHKIDTGHILLQEKVAISDTETAGTLHEKLKEAGANLLVKTLEKLLSDTLIPIPQDGLINGEMLPVAPKIHTENCAVHWQNEGKKIEQFVRGLNPIPAAFTKIDGKICKLFEVDFEEKKHTFESGTMQTDGKTFVRFACIDGFIFLKSLQIANKKRMSVKDFLNGYQLK